MTTQLVINMIIRSDGVTVKDFDEVSVTCTQGIFDIPPFLGRLIQDPLLLLARLLSILGKGLPHCVSA